MWKVISIVSLVILILSFYSGCLEEQSSTKLEMVIETDSSEFPVQLIVTSIESNRAYNWTEVNITISPQTFYPDHNTPIYIDKIGQITNNDVIEISESIFEDISKVYVTIRFHKSSLVIWSDTVLPPVLKPNVTFLVIENNMTVENIDKIDFNWDFTLSIDNETHIASEHLYKKYKSIEIGDGGTIVIKVFPVCPVKYSLARTNALY